MIAVLSPPFIRNFLIVTTQLIGTAIDARGTDAANDGGFLCAPFTVPSSAKFRLPTSVFMIMQNIPPNGLPDLAAKFQLTTTVVNTLGTITTTTQTFLWQVPLNFTVGDIQRVLFDNGLSQTYNPNTFRRDDTVGLRISRLGSDVEDTYNRGIKLASYLDWQIDADLCD
jgi:hypothetical protein